jgi:hypothetical protein
MAFCVSTGGAVYNPIWYDWSQTTPSATTTTIWQKWAIGSSSLYATATTSSITVVSTGYANIWYVWTKEGFKEGFVACDETPSPEKLAEAAKRIEKAVEDVKAEEAKRRLAFAKARRLARQLLRMVLTKAEREEWRMFRSVRVHGSDGGYYQVWTENGQSRVCEMKKTASGDFVAEQKYCYHAPHTFCVEDQIAALILDIKCDESRIKKIGNKNTFWNGEKERIERRVPVVVTAHV